MHNLNNEVREFDTERAFNICLDKEFIRIYKGKEYLEFTNTEVFDFLKTYFDKIPRS